MKRTLLLIATLALAGLVAFAAPAMSVRPYVPEPVEAEMAAPRSEVAPDSLSAASSKAFLSQPVRAPVRFNTVGFNWEGDAEPAIAVRVRREGEAWGPWTPVPAESDGNPDPGTGESVAHGVSAPVWAGESDFLQYRLSRRPPGLRLHFINTTGTATAADRVETAVREAAHGAFVAVASVAAPAEAGDTAPRMVSRARWGASRCKPRRRPSYGRVKVAFVHHTVTANSYSRSQARAMVLGICRYHRNSQGWDDIGYNFLVDRFGRIYEGRAGGIGHAVIGAQTQGFNDESTGVASLGTHTSQRIRRKGLRAIARLLRWKLPHHGRPTDGRATLVSDGGELNPYPRGERVRLRRISGHRDGGSTSCPGGALYRQLPRLRRMSDVTPPDPPANVRARPRAGAVRVLWDANSEPDLDSYRVYRQTLLGDWKRIAQTRRTAFLDRRRKVGRTYTYRLRARDARGNLSVPSAEASATVTRAAP